MGRRSYQDQEDVSGVFDWIFEEAKEKVVETCSGSNYDPDADRDDTSESITEDSYGTTDYTRSSCAEDSTVSSRVSLAYSEGDSTRDLQRKAHLLTQKIMEQERRMSQFNSPYKYKNKTEENTNDTIRKSKPSQYFVPLNDMNYKIDRRKSILDEEGSFSASSVGYTPTSDFDHEFDEESGRYCVLPKMKNGSRVDEEEREERSSTQKKKNWTKKGSSNSHDGQEKLEKVKEKDNFADSEDFTTVFSPGETDNIRTEKILARKVKMRRKVLFCSLLGIFLIFAGASVACMFFLFNWGESTSISTINSGIDGDSKDPLIRTNSSFGDDSPWGDSGDSSSETDDSASIIAIASTSTNEILSQEENQQDVADTNREDDNESSISFDNEQPSTIIPTTETYEEDYAVSEVDNELLENHLEAYERWKQENGIGTDNNEDGRKYDDGDDDVNVNSIDIEFGDTAIESRNDNDDT